MVTLVILAALTVGGALGVAYLYRIAPPLPYTCSDCGERAESGICPLCLEARR